MDKKCPYCDMELFFEEECECPMSPATWHDWEDDGMRDDGMPLHDDYSDESEP